MVWNQSSQHERTGSPLFLWWVQGKRRLQKLDVVVLLGGVWDDLCGAVVVVVAAAEDGCWTMHIGIKEVITFV